MAFDAAVFLPYLHSIRASSIALHKSAAELRVGRSLSDDDRAALFQSVPGQLAAVLTATGDFIAASDEWEAVLGYDPDALEGHNWREFVHPDDLAETVAQKERADPATGIIRATNRWRHRDGHYLPMYWCAASWEAHENYLVGGVCTSPSSPPRSPSSPPTA